MTTTDRTALLAAVAANPDDDTPRLMLADYLDGLDPVRVPCPKCKGSKIEHRGRSGWIDCPACGGAGTVLDTADADRAEFIRVQCELTRSGLVDERFPMRLRADELLDRHRAEWRKCPCPECGGVGFRAKHFHCQTCGGTGDLFRGFGGRLSETARAEFDRTVHFGRGFPDSVECTAADVWREAVCEGCYDLDSLPKGGAYGNFRRSECPSCDATGRVTVPTEWAKAVVRCAPVVAFRVSDKEPATGSKGFVWRFDRNRPDLSEVVPEAVFADEWEYISPSGGYGRGKTFDLYQAARDALALAVGKWVRGHPAG